MRRRAKIAAAAAAVCAGAALWARLGAIPDALFEPGSSSTVIVDRRGIPLYEARAPDGTRRGALSADSLPEPLVRATLAAEDHRFFSHVGVDPLAVARAVARDVAARRRVEGGSTITQQVAKLLLIGEARRNGRPVEPRSWTMKIRETVLALRLEHRFSKRELLALYLNLAPYGNEIVGADRASRVYFGCAPSLLTPAQAAFLAGLPQRPSGFNPYRQVAAASRRQRLVLARMERFGWLTPAEAHEALAERVALAHDPAAWLAPHFTQMVLAEAGDARPAHIETTLDAALQREVEGIVRAERHRLDAHGAHNVAVAVLDNATGEWLAWEGSGDYFDAEHGGAIDGVQSPRQPGSALKPFTYALAFDRGFSPASVLPDVPSHFPTADPGVVYVPRNYDGRYRGPLRARLALAGSENVPAVALAAEVGVPSLLRLLRRAGLTTFDKTAAYYGLGATLGDAEVTLAELVAAYAMLARGGEWIAPQAILRARADRGSPVRVISDRAAFWVTDILSDNDAREYAFGRGGSLEFHVPVAVKTGTSQGYHDNWTIGFTREITAGVWVGNFDRTPMRNSSGVTGAGPIFHAVILAALKRTSAADVPARAILPPPPGVVRAPICALSGMRANAWCPSKVGEWIETDAPVLACSWHHLSDEGLLVFWPPQYREWARSQGLPDGGREPRVAAAAAPAARRDDPARFAIVSPASGATYSIDPTLRRQFQRLPLRSVGASGGRVDWTIDGRPIGNTSADAALMWSLAPGAHRVAARDGRGRTAEVAIMVK